MQITLAFFLFPLIPTMTLYRQQQQRSMAFVYNELFKRRLESNFSGTNFGLKLFLSTCKKFFNS